MVAMYLKVQIFLTLKLLLSFRNFFFFLKKNGIYLFIIVIKVFILFSNRVDTIKKRAELVELKKWLQKYDLKGVDLPKANTNEAFVRSFLFCHHY